MVSGFLGLLGGFAPYLFVLIWVIAQVGLIIIPFLREELLFRKAIHFPKAIISFATISVGLESSLVAWMLKPGVTYIMPKGFIERLPLTLSLALAGGAVFVIFYLFHCLMAVGVFYLFHSKTSNSLTFKDAVKLFSVSLVLLPLLFLVAFLLFVPYSPIFFRVSNFLVEVFGAFIGLYGFSFLGAIILYFLTVPVVTLPVMMIIQIIMLKKNFPATSLWQRIIIVVPSGIFVFLCFIFTLSFLTKVI